MNKIQLEPHQAIELFRIASVGKLISGLIHNLNGPLHTLGIEMDVMNFLFSKTPNLDPSFSSNFSTRLKRMEEEFGKLNNLIRQVADRAELFSSTRPNRINLNYLIREELEFLQANLYFKHSVKTTLDLDENIEPLEARVEYLPIAIRWFLQSLVEDIEKNQIRTLSIRTRATHDQLSLSLITHDNPLSSELIESIKYEPQENVLASKNVHQIEFLLAISLLKSYGVSIRNDTSSYPSAIYLIFPYE